MEVSRVVTEADKMARMDEAHFNLGMVSAALGAALNSRRGSDPSLSVGADAEGFSISTYQSALTLLSRRGADQSWVRRSWSGRRSRK